MKGLSGGDGRLWRCPDGAGQGRRVRLEKQKRNSLRTSLGRGVLHKNMLDGEDGLIVDKESKRSRRTDERDKRQAGGRGRTI